MKALPQLICHLVTTKGLRINTFKTCSSYNSNKFNVYRHYVMHGSVDSSNLVLLKYEDGDSATQHQDSS